jgi:hypothetical protein
MIEIPIQILQYAQLTQHYYVPHQRTGGFQELDTQKRGDGDLTDLLGSLMVYHLAAQQDVICRIELCCGAGDKSDLELSIGGQFKTVNIKTSSYAPYRDGLNLFVKEEELNKDIDLYMQVFVHLNEGDAAPHIHIAGCVSRNSAIWKKHNRLITIPNTGYPGIGIPVAELGSFDVLMKLCDKKPNG